MTRTTRPCRCCDGWSRPVSWAASPAKASTSTERSSATTRGARLPVEPPPTSWQLPSADTADAHGVVGIGADLEPGTILAAYRSGLFPMPLGLDGPIGWWSPDPRGVLPLDGPRMTRSLRRSTRRYDVRMDTAFEAVVESCRTLPRNGGWITDEIRDAYVLLHHLGWTHSFEAWTPEGELVGGLYGIAIGGFFAGESMFHTRTDASKVALVELVRVLREGGAQLLDVQWQTDHLATLGAIEIPRAEYLRRLRRALEAPLPEVFRGQ